jgi:hypothetical protein
MRCADALDVLWALRCEGMTADERADLAAAWAAPLAPATPDTATAGGETGGGAEDGAADDEWARQWAREMGLTA